MTATAAIIDYGQDPEDVRPRVADDRGNRPLWLSLGAILMCGLILFAVLEGRRTAVTAPQIKPRASDLALASPAQTQSLYVPPEPIVIVSPTLPALPPAVAQPPAKPVVTLAPPMAVAAPPLAPMAPVAPISIAAPPAPPPPVSTTPAIVLDLTTADSEGSGAGQAGTTPAIASRARAMRTSVNRATVVPQGTLISAVLETALDSTQPGQVRALVSTDVPNLYGSTVLIPRGSRLFGNYQGALASGQSRATVQWTRLVRPDGVAVAIDSPAADRLGRAGIKGRVNNHFFERLSGALLQSVIDVGSLVAARSVYDSPVLVAVPGRVQSAASGLVGNPPQPTLSVKPGMRISVFVVRDLDFTGVETRR
jgi:type IV secretion system protein VirB10